MAEHMVTTVDNPFNPFHQFEEWDAWDQAHGYFTHAYMARILVTSPDLVEADQDQAIEDAVEEIVRENILGIYIKVTAEDQVPRIPSLPSI